MRRDPPAVGLNNGVTDGQAQTQATSVAAAPLGKKRLEHLLERSLGHAPSIVANTQLDPSLGATTLYAHFARAQAKVGDPYANSSQRHTPSAGLGKAHVN